MTQAKDLAVQLAKVHAGDLFPRTVPWRMRGQDVELIKEAVSEKYSTHEIARALLDKPDELVEWGCGGLYISSDVCQPAIPFTPAVWAQRKIK